jgi:hypothetical protein
MAFFLLSQSTTLARALLSYAIIRRLPPLFDRAHLFWRISRSSDHPHEAQIGVNGQPKCGEKGRMSTRDVGIL